MFAFIAAFFSGAPRCNQYRSSLTWASVTRRTVPIGNSFHQKLPSFYR
jgi:hypothetical protein